MESCPESADGKEVEFEPHFGYTMEGSSVHKDGQGKQKLTGDWGGDSKSEKAFKYNDSDIGIAASDNSMKDRENNPYLDYKEMKVGHPRAFDHKDSGYMTDFNGEKEELQSELSNSVQEIHTEQEDSCGGQKGNGSSICVTHEFDDKMVEEEVERAFGFKNKQKKHRIVCDVGDSASEGHQEVNKNDNINNIKTVHQDPCALHTCKNLLPGKTLFNHAEESDVNNFICIRKNKTYFRTLCDCIWNSFHLLLRSLCMDGNAALNDGPTCASSEFTQDINTEQRHMILVQRDIQVQSQNEVSSESHTLGALTKDMGSPAFTVVANTPRQPGIAVAHTSGQVTLRSLNQVCGREATSASHSNELLMVVPSGENANEKNPAKASATEEIFSRRQVSEKSETIVQRQNEASLELHTLGSLTKDMGSPAVTVVANMPHQPGIVVAHTSGQVTLRSLDEISGREATGASQSHELLMVVPSGENADEKNPAKASAAEEILPMKQVSEKSETIELKEHQQKPDIKSKISQDQDELNSKMNWYMSKTWDKVSDLGSCKPHIYISSTNYICCIINILVYAVALEPRQNDVSNLVTETASSLPPTVYHSVAVQVDGQNVLTAASQTVNGHPNSRGSSNNSPQEPQRGMDQRINDPTNSPAFQSNDTGFTTVHLASGRVTDDASQDSGLTLPSAPVHESDLNITSVELLRASDVSGMTPLPEARSQHSSGDTRCRDEEDGNGSQTDAGRHASDLSQLPVTEQAADGNPFHIAAARSTQNEQPSEVYGINNKPASPVNSHGVNGDTGSIKLQAIRSTDPGNGSTAEKTCTVHVPTRTFNQDDSSANPVEMASMNLASGGLRNTNEEASGGGQNENRGESTSIQETDSAQPKYPQYASNYQRMNSFQGWPARLRQRPEEMAECGFYYAGFNDCVRCFHCGVGLRQWMHEDDPWFEHARWSPSCFYVCKIKGNDFVCFVLSAVTAMYSGSNPYGFCPLCQEFLPATELGVLRPALSSVLSLVVTFHLVFISHYLNIAFAGCTHHAIEKEAARKNATGNDSSNNTKESANGKNKDMNNETEETAIEHEPNMIPDIFPEVLRQPQEHYDPTICRICLDRKRSVIFLPCGHFGTCTWCSSFLQECPFCRRLIVKKIKITDC